jgi:RIO-like serine/threonine protein kinase
MSKISLDGWEQYSRGHHGEILKNGNKIMKIPHKPFCSILEKMAKTRMENEFFIQQRLFEYGIKVARPYELTEILVGEYVLKAIIMEFIDGWPAIDLPFKKRIQIIKIHDREIKKCEQFGFEPSDASLNNCIYSENKGLYLVDFANWRLEK